MTSKKTIPKPLKDLVWETYIGNDIATTKCLCCENNEIRMNNFHCSHVIAESKGGTMTVENLRPICATCNLAMKTENMYEFKRRCGFMKVPPGLKVESLVFKPEIKISNDTMTWYAGISYKIKPKFLRVPCEKLPVNGIMRDWPILSALREMRVELYGRYREVDEYVFERV
jgi:hypothetical protein